VTLNIIIPSMKTVSTTMRSIMYISMQTLSTTTFSAMNKLCPHLCYAI